MANVTRCLVALASLAGMIGCSDRPPTTAPPKPQAAASPAVAARQAKSEALARRMALALQNPAFRAYVKTQLDASPVREHKLHFQRFLGADGGRAVAVLAGRSGATAADVEDEARAAPELEMYLPVPAHRRAWQGDASVLVATAIRDHDPPVAFDARGNRLVLSPDQPPATPVIALVPVETDFAPRPSVMLCYDDCSGGGGGGGGTSPPAPPALGLYMTQSHFTQDFEGWLKGSPEFEVHILGQKGQTDSLTDYQCAGERQPVPYYFDQNDLDWSGSVLLFGQSQIDAYNAAHPGQNVRVFVVEDDDTACEIKNDPNRFANLLHAVDSAFAALTAGNDSTSGADKVWKVAHAFQKLVSALASVINTNDELVGDAVQDGVAGEFHDGFNWIVKGENNVTNGWLKLEMR
ncbi:MAG TPA: hypothetical protein VEK78_08970 [Gemmatimonadales bacterium]|nr:hypothetical protein [Gemmatimonadales bacterium]